MTHAPTHTCPECGGTLSWEGNRWRPFCSQRCKMLDLGKWTTGEYVINGPSREDFTPDDDLTPADQRRLRDAQSDE